MNCLANFLGNDELAEKLDGLLDTLSQVALYIAIAVIVAFVVWAIVIRNRDEEHLAKARKAMGIVALVVTAILLLGLGGLKLTVKIFEGAFDGNFFITMGMFAIVIVGVIACVIADKKAKNTSKWIALGFVALFVVYAVVMSALVPTSEDYQPINDMDLLYVVLTLALVAIIAVLALLGSKNAQFDTKAIAYGAVCVALSFALSYVKFFSMPQGGSVTFASLLPLVLYSYMFGTRRGVIVGVVYGLLQFAQSPQFYQPVQVLIDYPIAFGAIGVAGLCRNWKILKGNIFAEFVVGATIAVILRYCAHTLSGYFVFYSWAPIDQGYTALTWTLVYNLYVLVDLAIVLAMGVFALASKSLRHVVKTTGVDSFAQQEE